MLRSGRVFATLVNSGVTVDNLAPPFPTGVAGADGAGSVTFTCDPTADMHDGATAATGITSYTLNVGGADQTAVAVNGTTILANVRVQPAIAQIGSFSPAPTLVQSGVQFTLTSKGTGIDDATSDQLGFAFWEVTGDFDLYVPVAAFSGIGSIYSPGGAMWRECSAATCAASAGKKFGALYRFLTANNSGVQGVERLTDNTVRVVRGTATTGNNAARWLHIRKRRSGTDVFTYRWSSDGGTWTTYYTSSAIAGLSNTLCVGFFTSDLQNAGAASDVQTMVVNGTFYTAGAQAAISKAFTTSVSVSGKWKATDVHGNVSAYGPAISASGATPTGSAVTWNPGHYLRPTQNGNGNVPYYDLSDAGVLSNTMSFVDTIIGQTPNIKGVLVPLSMGAIEKTLNNYTWTNLDTLITKIESYGLRWGTVLSTQADQIGTYSFPQYMLDDPTTYFAGRQANNQYDNNLRWWTTTARNRLIAFYQAFATRYGTRAKFEKFKLTWETSFDAYTFNTATPDPQFTYANALAGWTALAQAWHAAAPTKMCDQWWNDAPKDDTLETFQEYFAVAKLNFCMWNNPNSVHNTADTSQIAAIGMGYDGAAAGVGNSFIDYSLQMPMCAAGNDANDFYSHGTNGPNDGTAPYQSLATQWSDKSASRTCVNFPSGSGTGVHGNFTWSLPSPLTMKWNNASHYEWFVNTFAGNSSNQWPQSLPAFIEQCIAATPTPTVPTCFATTGVVTGA